MSPLKISKKKYVFFIQMLQELRQNNHITQDEYTSLLTRVAPISFEWSYLARYTSLLAVLFVITALIVTFSDKYFIELLLRIASSADSVKALLLTIASALLYWRGAVRYKRCPESTFLNEAILLLAVLTTAGAIGFTVSAMHLSFSSYPSILLLSALFYALLGYVLNSKLICTVAVVALTVWFGFKNDNWQTLESDSSITSHLRYALFGALLTTSSWLVKKTDEFSPFHTALKWIGLPVFFTSLLLTTHHTPETGVTSMAWSALLLLASIISTYIGIKWEENAYRWYGMLFFLIVIYTRFYDYFSEHLHKGIFFLLLGVSFYLISVAAEKIKNRPK